MDVFLVQNGKIINCVVVESEQQARELYNCEAVERTPENQHLWIGDEIS